jgi:putative phosphoribosyl transferase
MDPMPRFDDREQAGRMLAEAYGGPTDLVVMGIARGGVPVGYPMARRFNSVLEVITARKLPIPWSPEMGFGAVAPDGSTVLNRQVVHSMGISRADIDRVSSEVLQEVKRREKVYRGGLPQMDIEGMNVILADDGMATGYTMIAAVEMVQNQGAREVTVAAPVSPADTAERLRTMADEVIILYEAHTTSFAVAGFYRDFHDMEDGEVTTYLRRARAERAASPQG